MKNRLAGCDIIRSIAIICVLLSHASFFIYGNFKNEGLISTIINYQGATSINQSYDNSIVIKFLNNIGKIFHYTDVGLFGVCLFFLLSGYLFAKQSYTQSTLKIFIRRFLRIYVPIVVIYVIGINLILFFLNRSYEPYNHILSISSLGLKVPTMGILWTINSELFFYLVFLIFRPNNAKRIIISIITLFILHKASHAVPFLSFFRHDFAFKWCIYILIGCAIANGRYYNVIFGLFLFLTGKESLFEICSAYALFLSLYKIQTIQAYLSKVFSFIAKISYSIYLLHMFTFGLVSYNLQRYFNTSIDVYILYSFIATILFSYISFLFIEKPSITLGHKACNSKYIDLLLCKITAIKVRTYKFVGIKK